MKAKLFITLAIIITIVFAGAIFLRSIYVIPVLMYHAVDYDFDKTKLSVSPESFARQMEFLHRNHYNVVTLDRIVSYMEKREKIPLKTVAITFDDGYYNNYKYAYPVLKRYGIPATIFVITDKIGKTGFLGWPEIEEMAKSGVVTIGSHTKSHSWLPSLDDKDLKDQLADSKEIIESRTGKPVEFLCYPIGAHDERVQEAVRQAGYLCAVATNPGKRKSSKDVYAIKRIKISRTSDNMLIFGIESSGYYTWIKEKRDK